MMFLFKCALSGTSVTRIVFKKDNLRCGAILQHEMKKIAVLIFAPPWLFIYYNMFKFKWTEPLFLELSCTKIHRHTDRQPDRQT